MLYYASIVSEGLPITTVSRPGGGDSVVIGRPSGGRRADGLNKGIYGSFTGVQKKQEQSIVVHTYAICIVRIAQMIISQPRRKDRANYARLY